MTQISPEQLPGHPQLGDNDEEEEGLTPDLFRQEWEQYASVRRLVEQAFPSHPPILYVGMGEDWLRPLVLANARRVDAVDVAYQGLSLTEEEAKIFKQGGRPVDSPATGSIVKGLKRLFPALVFTTRPYLFIFHQRVSALGKIITGPDKTLGKAFGSIGR